MQASWCAPCKLIAPKIEDMAAELTDVKFGKVKSDCKIKMSDGGSVSFSLAPYSSTFLTSLFAVKPY